MPTMTAAARYAALTALSAGLADQIAKAKADALAEVAHLRKASFPTPFGQVNMTRAEPKITLDPAAFLALVEEHYPDEVITTRTVRSSFSAAFLAELVAVGAQVVHRGTGEVVECARLTPEGDPVLSWPASAAQRDAKDLARMLFDERAEQLVSGLVEVTAA